MKSNPVESNGLWARKKCMGLELEVQRRYYPAKIRWQLPKLKKICCQNAKIYKMTSLRLKLGGNERERKKGKKRKKKRRKKNLV